MGKITVGLGAFAVLLLPAAARAQPAPGPPIPLLPPAPPAAPAPIARRPLAPPAAGWSGGPAAPARALPPSLWRGTPRARAEMLLARLPATTAPALQALARRLLLSPGAAPRGPDLPGTSLPALRAAALLRLGETRAARLVLAQAAENAGPAGPRLAVAAAAIAGHEDRACAAVRRAIRTDQSLFWQRALIACQALAGKVEEARLGIALLAEEKQPPGRALTLAVAALSGRPAAPVARLAAPTPLLLRLLVRARLPLARKLVEGLSPDLALTLALDDKAPPETRLAAAERAARFGALPPARLAALYARAAGSAAAGTDPSLARARRFAAIAGAGAPGDHLARMIAFAKESAGPHGGGSVLAARLVLPQLREVAPDPALAGPAPSAARLALAAGDDRLARRWSALAAGNERERLGFVLALAASPARAEGAAPAREAGPPVLRIALLAALGDPVPARAWLSLPAGAWNGSGRSGVAPAPWLVLAAAAPAKRVGEGVLASLLVAGAGGRLSRDPLALNAAIGGLMRIGLAGAARRIAVEAALAAGL